MGMFFTFDLPSTHYSSTFPAAASRAKRPPARVACPAYVGIAMFVLDEVGCEVVEARESSVLTGARVETAEGPPVDETVAQSSQPWGENFSDGLIAVILWGH